MRESMNKRNDAVASDRLYRAVRNATQEVSPVISVISFIAFISSISAICATCVRFILPSQFGTRCVPN